MNYAERRVTSGGVDPRSLHQLSVLVDARKLDDGGIGTYTSTILRGLADRRDLLVYALVKPGSERARSLPRSINLIANDTRPYSAREFFSLGRFIDRGPWDVVHIPHYTLPFGIHKPTVVTVHDLIHLHSPSRWYLPLVARPLIGSMLARATRVIAVSEATARDVTKTFALPPEVHARLSVIPNIRPVLSVAPNLRRERGEKMLLSLISQDKPHKGIDDLIRAFTAVVEKGMSARLFIAGYGIEKARSRLEARVRNLPIEVLGAVREDEIANLYRSAHAVIVPSTLEGFGLAALEGIDAGAWVVTRPVAALSEVITSKDIVASSMSVSALSDAIAEVLQREVRSSVESTEERALHLSRFSAECLIPKLVDVYRAARSDAERLR